MSLFFYKLHFFQTAHIYLSFFLILKFLPFNCSVRPLLFNVIIETVALYFAILFLFVPTIFVKSLNYSYHFTIYLYSSQLFLALFFLLFFFLLYFGSEFSYLRTTNWHLLCVIHCSRQWEYNLWVKQTKSLPSETYHLVGEITRWPGWLVRMCKESRITWSRRFSQGSDHIMFCGSW